jgi:peptidoglycan-associated lipoprotein
MGFFKLFFLLLIAVTANAQISGGLPPVKKSEPQKPAPSQTKSSNTQVKSEEQIAVEREDAFWNEIKTLSSKEAYEIYLKRYPNGRYVEVAKSIIQSLTTIAPANTSPTQPSQLFSGATQGVAPAGLNVVYFDYDSLTLKPEARSVLERNAAYLQVNKQFKVQLEGHTDERGSREYNLSIGQKRAETVRRALILLGSNDAQLEAVSFGEEKPAASGTDEATYAKNRRVEIKY